MSEIVELLDSSAIALDHESADWREAVRFAGSLLEKSAACSEQYTQSMIENAERNGPYIVVAPGFAFAHARPSEAVHRTAMSWVRLKSPVEFGHAKNDPVTLVVALAANDDSAHTRAMQQLAKVLGLPKKRAALDQAATPEEVLDILGHSPKAQQTINQTNHGVATTQSGSTRDHQAQGTTNKILTVCGNGLGTSLFLKNTLEQVLEHWGWGSYITVEATDTISAKGKAKEADLILTSGEIARTLGDPGIPVKVIENFTSMTELDAVLRDSYDV
ncbi:PTS sugar transporter subunit IIA [Kocuria sp.]|uniref:PTS sugar transporter subunit IIA n=1 Tax=Kocuria sp. TaxID=1871328 RepID=UPI00289DF9E9|nr:PTS sugar transporter subunit IIA [Kocuria sp.]